ncbi:MAG TPA: DUF1569 domain-containing protein [Noviherbaspirillum sp.]|nr:DUF1569 domain-containing protein [Noviherbaspirillum sp.]
MAAFATRRTLLIAGGIVAGAGTAGLLWVRAGNDGAILTVDAALQKIDALAKGTVTSTGKWNPHQVFTHCAQSIEYSMSGYPAPKPKLFQDTAGAAAFALFSAKGKMRHGLAEQIDGAPALEAKTDTAEALARLRQAFLAFRQFGGAFAPHFAYGPLDKQQYEQAHVMHFYNHLDEIKAQG